MATSSPKDTASSTNNFSNGDAKDERAAATDALANPYHFPDFFLNKGDRLYGAPVWRIPWISDQHKHIQQIRELPMRADDVLLTVYPKCGTHWTFEILHMLTSGSASYCPKTKEFTELEFTGDLTTIDKLPSPRVLNTHLPFAQLPKEIVDKKVKIVHVIRNPKDTVVSFYHQIDHDTPPDEFNFQNFLKGYMTDEYLAMSHQFDYLRQVSEFEKSHPGVLIKHLHFEDLKESPEVVIEDLAKFLGTRADKQFCKEVADACGFKKMKKAVESRAMPQHVIDAYKGHKVFETYRKGQVGDWKNTFTVAQNEIFDEFLRVQTEKGCAFTFKGDL